MTTMQDSGVVDMSGAISSMLRSYQNVLAGYQRMVTGDPAAIANAGTILSDRASTLSSVSSDLGQRATTLNATWDGAAHDAFTTATGQLTAQVNGVATALRQEAARLEEAANLLRQARSEVDEVVAQFQQAAQTLINESRTAAVGAVNAFVQAAQQLGDSAVNAAKKVTDEANEKLAEIFGIVEEIPEDKHTGSSETEAYKKKWGSQRWFDKDDVLDGRKRPKSAPWSTFGNSGWYSVTTNGVKSAKAPLKENTPFGALESPSEDQQGLKLWHDTNVTLLNSGEKTALDGTFVDDKTGGKLDLGDYGTAKGYAEFDAGLKVTDQGSVSMHGGYFQASGEVKATLVDANAAASYEDGSVSANARGDAMIGADVAGHLTVANGVEAHVNAFAGAQATGSVNADVGGVGVGASGALQAGVGVQLDGQATYANGHIVVNGKVGAALGLGASVSANIDIDVPKIENEVSQYGTAALAEAQAYGTAAANAVQNAAGSVEYAAGQAAGAIGNVFRNAGNYVGAW